MMEPTQDIETKSSAKKHFFLMALLVVLLLGVAVYANSWKESRRVAEVVVEGNRILAAKDLLRLARIPANSVLFKLDLYAIEQRVMRNEFVKSVVAHRDIPNRLRISIDERVPVAALLLDGLFYLDAEGYVLPAVRSQFIFDLPVLTGSMSANELSAGRKTKNRNVLDALSLLAAAKNIDEDLHRNISEVRIDDANEFTLYTSELGVPVFFGRGDAGTKLVMFAAFWKSVVAQQGVQQLQYIDLRFEDQVVVRYSMRSEAKNHTSSVSDKSLLIH